MDEESLDEEWKVIKVPRGRLPPEDRVVSVSLARVQISLLATLRKVMVEV